jgi:quercetin dioxygenase-like cupin family protein
MRGPVLVVALSLAFTAGIAVGQARPRMWADKLIDVSTEELPRRARVWVNVDHWEPGAETGRHTHPGPTVFVLLEGELEETLADGKTRTLKAGQGYWKPARAEHNVRNGAGQLARALAVHLDPR